MDESGGLGAQTLVLTCSNAGPMRAAPAGVVVFQGWRERHRSAPLPSAGQPIGIRRPHGPQATVDVNGQSTLRRRIFFLVSFFFRWVGGHMARHCSHVRVRGSGFWKGLSSVCLAVVLSTPAGVHEHEPCSSQSSHLRRTPVVQRMNPHHTVSRRPMSPRRADRLKPGPLRIPRWQESTIPDSQTARARMPPGHR